MTVVPVTTAQQRDRPGPLASELQVSGVCLPCHFLGPCRDLTACRVLLLPHISQAYRGPGGGFLLALHVSVVISWSFTLLPLLLSELETSLFLSWCIILHFSAQKTCFEDWHQYCLNYK